MSIRTEQVASVIHRAIQTVLAEGLSDPRLAPIITVTKVAVTKDLRDATVYVTMLPEDKKDLTMHGLRSASRHIRHRISDKIALPKTPDLHFKHDLGAQNQQSILRTLSELRDEENPENQTVAPSEDGGDAETDT